MWCVLEIYEYLPLGDHLIPGGSLIVGPFPDAESAGAYARWTMARHANIIEQAVALETVRIPVEYLEAMTDA